MVIEPPFCRPPVTPLSVPVTEPRPVLDPVPEPLLPLLPSPRPRRIRAGPGAKDPAGRVEPAQRDRGVLRLRERGRGDAHRQDGRRGGTPEQNSPVIHEALHFDVVIAENMTRLVKLTVKLTAGHSAGIRRLRAGRKDRSAPPIRLRSCDRRRKPGKQRSPQSIRHLFTIAPFQLGVWKSTGPRFVAFGEPNSEPSTL